MALREVLAELFVDVRGLGSVDAASKELDRYVKSAGGAADELERLRVQQQEAAELAGRIMRRIRALQRAEGDHAQQIAELRLAFVRAQEAARDYGRQADALRHTEQRATSTTGGFVAGVRGMAGPLAAITAAAASAGAAIAGVTAAIRETIETADALDDTATRLGLSTRALQEWQFIADRAGISAEELEQAFNRVAQKASAGRGPWRELGIAVRDARGQLRSQDELFEDIVGALGRVDNQTRRAALAQDLFGRSGAKLLTLVAQGPEAITELRDRFAELGGGLSDDVIEGATAADDALGDFRLAMLSLKAAMSADLLPALTRLVNGAAAVVGKLSELWRTSSAGEAIFGTLAVAAGLLFIAMAPLSIPTLALIAVFGLLFLAMEDVVTAFRGGESVFGSVVESFAEMMGVSLTFTGILEQVGIRWEILKAQVLDAVAGIVAGVAQMQRALGIELVGNLDQHAESARAAAQGARDRVRSLSKQHVLGEARRKAERLTATLPAASGSGKAGAQVNAPTTINVNGATDPEGVRRVVSRELARRNRELADTIGLAEPEAAT